MRVQQFIPPRLFCSPHCLYSVTLRQFDPEDKLFYLCSLYDRKLQVMDNKLIRPMACTYVDLITIGDCYED